MPTFSQALIARRQWLVLAACSLTWTMKAEAGEDDPASVAALRRQWMETAFGDRAVTGMLHLARFLDDIYVTTREIGWTRSPQDGDTAVTEVKVPPGFVTDLTSVPRVFWTLLRPDGMYSFAAVVHDYLYWTQQTSREEADRVLHMAMKDLRVNDRISSSIYQAVSVFGRGAWEANRELKAAGERRVIRRLPDRPDVKWVDWKKGDIY